MRKTLTPLAVLAGALSFGCRAEQPAPEAVLPAQPNPPAPVAATWRPPAPLPPTPTEVGAAPSACGVQPGAFTAPVTGATLAGQAALAVPLTRAASCNGTPGTVFKVINPQSLVVYSACVSGDPGTATWDTRQAANGSYWITAQSACGCVACAEYAYVEVTVRN
jgi:hypothetical protein